VAVTHVVERSIETWRVEHDQRQIGVRQSGPADNAILGAGLERIVVEERGRRHEQRGMAPVVLKVPQASIISASGEPFLRGRGTYFDEPAARLPVVARGGCRRYVQRPLEKPLEQRDVELARARSV
jgi:hypothetical protein